MQVCVKTFVALLHKPNDTFGGLKIYADDTQVKKKEHHMILLNNGL